MPRSRADDARSATSDSGDLAAEQQHAFDQLATEVSIYQALHVAPVGSLWKSRGVEPLDLRDWREAPPVPATAFKSFDLHSVPAERVFASSGTSRGAEERSHHHHGDLELYREIVDRTFPRYALRQPAARLPTLSLIPPAAIVPESSLAFMVEHVLERFSAGDSRYAYGGGGLHPRAAAAWLQHHAQSREPVLLLTTAVALWDLTVELERTNEYIRLGPESVVFETGGFKTSEGQIERPELLERAATWLGLGTEAVVREYGMTELTSQAYTEVLHGGAPDRFVTPPWMQVRILDPDTLEQVPEGREGLISIFDLGNLASVSHLLTEDLGVADADGGFQLLGRAHGAELRGCSLLGEQLAGSSE